jgi:hypothetical protein
MRRADRLPCLLVAAVMPACFNPPSNDDDVDLTGRDTEAVDTEGPSTDGPSTDGPSTDGPSTDTSDTESAGDPVCGDGVVEGDEVCDDGVNDGSYGGCLEDCSGLAEHCGDGVVNGPEVCDDGINDGSYDGCEADCSALGPHCGDGIVQDPEMCDAGEANENGTGCNIDCVTSGTVLESWESDPLSFCEGGALTPPVFRENGNILVAAGGWCQADDRILLELSPELALLENDSVVVPQPPGHATMLGSDWLLSAFRCNYLVAESGTLTEVCSDQRQSGERRVEAWDDDSYLTVDFGGHVARFGAGSPAPGDSPTWSVTEPGTGNPGYWYQDATFATDGSVVIGGYRRLGSSTPYAFSGYVRRLTAAGNPAGSWLYEEIPRIDGIRKTHDGGYVAWSRVSIEGDVGLVKLDGSFAVQWSNSQFQYISNVEVDSVGQIVVDHSGPDWQVRPLVKLDADGNELWQLDFPGQEGTQLGIDPSDAIVRASAGWANDANFVGVTKISP